MMTLRRTEERGLTDWGWLDSRHTFSFGEYHDPKYMGFRTLRVINDDRVAGGAGFGTHPHRDMEIITYMLQGALEHKDSMGNGSVIRMGEIQRMSAGSGITHSEFNPSKVENAHLLQIWIRPDEKGITPEYEQKPVDIASHQNEWVIAVSGRHENGLLRIHQDARMLLGQFGENTPVQYSFENGRGGWLNVISGTVQAGGYTLSEGDALQIEDEETIEIQVKEQTELLLFDLR